MRPRRKNAIWRKCRIYAVAKMTAAERLKNRRLERLDKIRLGICVVEGCKNDPEKGLRECLRHAQRNRNKIADYRRKCIAAGKCSACGGDKTTAKQKCAKCEIRQKKIHADFCARRRTAFLCRDCPNPAAPGRLRCWECCERRCKEAHAYYLANAERLNAEAMRKYYAKKAA